MPRDKADCISGVRSLANVDLDKLVWRSSSWSWLDVESFKNYHHLDPCQKGSNVGPGLGSGMFKSSVDLEVKPRLRITPVE